jgi:hypothetical protein
MTSSGGTETLDTQATVGKFRMVPSGQTSFGFSFASCEDTSAPVTYDTIAPLNDDLFIHLGDLWYADGSGTDLTNYRTQMGNKIGETKHQSVFGTRAAVFTPSDHDGGMADSINGTLDPTALANYNTVYREQIYSPTQGTGIYHTFTWGRIRFIVLDTRTFADSPGSIASTNKRKLGATQEAWLQNIVTTMTEPVAIVVSADYWSGPPTDYDDSWLGYDVERQRLANMFKNSGKNFVIISGDQHAVAADDGTNGYGIPSFGAAPIDRTSSQKGTWTNGPYPASGSTRVQQYGHVDVVDSGSTITLNYEGRSADGTVRISQSKSFTVGGTSKTGSDTAAISVTESSSLQVPKASTLKEDFSVGPDALLDPSASQTWANQAITLYAGANYPAKVSYGLYDLTNDSISVNMNQRPNGSNNSSEAYLIFNGNGGDWNNRVYIGWSAGFFIMSEQVNGVVSSTSVAANLDNFFRIRHSAGTLYWETSPDGISWTTRRSKVAGAVDYTKGKIAIQAGNYTNDPAPGSAKFDDVNILPNVSVKTASDFAAISVAEIESVQTTGTGPDETVAISVSEQSSTLVSQSRTDTTAISVSETSALFKTIVASDTAAISVSEVASTGGSSSAAGSDSAAIGVTEQSSVLVTTSAQDFAAISVAEIEALSGSTQDDGAAISVAETSSVLVIVSASDTAAMSVADSSASFRTIAASDTAAVAVSEVANSGQNNALPGTDTASIGVSESSSVFVTLSASDTAAISVSESTGSFRTLTASDSAAITISDATTLVKSIAASDTVAVTATESKLLTYADDFDRSSTTTGPGPLWVSIAPTTGPQIGTNQIVGGTAATGIRYALRTTGVQVSEVVYRGGTLIGPTVAMPKFTNAASLATAGTWYTFRQQGAGAGVHLAQKNAGATTHTTLASSATNLVAGDVVRVEWDGTTLRGFINGVQVLSNTPATPITGQVYVGFAHGSSAQSGTALIDNWRGGNVYAGPYDYKTYTGPAYDFPFENVNIATGWNDDPYHQFDGLRDGGTRAHRAIDMLAPEGTPVYAVTGGTIDSSYMPGFTEPMQPGVGDGYSLRIDSGNYRYVYGHFGPDVDGQTALAFAPGIVPGATVVKGQLLGWVGVSGSAGSGPHLHFEIRDLAGTLTDEPYADYNAALGSETAPRFDPYASMVSAQSRAAQPFVPKSASDTVSLTVNEISNTSGDSTLAGNDSVALGITEQAYINVTTSASDTAAISVAETRTQSSTLAASDAAAISVSESAATAVTVSATDSAAISVAETTSGSVTAQASDTAAISVSEISNVGSTLPGTETIALGVNESTSTFVTLSASDTAAISVSESRAQNVTLSSTDQAAISVAESRTQNVTLSASDSASIVVAESTSGFVAAVASDSASIAVTEVSNTGGNNALPGTDTASIGVTEQTSIFVTLSASDTAAISVAETSAPAVSVSANDTASIAVAESRATTAGITAFDTTAISVSESRTQAVSVSASDNSAISVSESAATTVGVSASDTAAVSVAETTSGFVTAVASDQAAITVSEIGNTGGNAAFPGTDSAAISVTEQSSLFVTVSSTDGAAISVAESRTQNISLAAQDAAAINVAESANQAVSVSTTDTGAISVSESTTTAVTQSASDTAAISVSESTSGFTTAQASDAASISVADSSSTLVIVTATDGAAISVAETRTQNATLASTDGAAISVAESRTQNATLSATDSAAVSVSEASSGFIAAVSSDSASISVNDVANAQNSTSLGTDSAAISVVEQSSLFKTMVASDQASISVSESTGSFKTLTATDGAAISVSETNSRFVTKTATDQAAISISENTAFFINRTLTASDSAAISIAEATGFTKNLSASDTVAISVTEARDKFIFYAGGVVFVYFDGEWHEGRFMVFSNGQWKEGTIKAGKFGNWR